ncbi:hypothetical protein FE257_005229 [Aspergillus nanangensis]|uniref:Uncharacterized protein n=1 Tax=Aspergillus nanangensis TaxID=2582783 RepID=A0AAD4CSM4_ASPNN|nr:hypothetical protein FE257_005229 [Aspergillus nanangensis]
MTLSNNEYDFAWKPTNPNRWERNIDEVEQFYTSLAKAHEGTSRTFFAMTGFISFSLPIEKDVTRQITEERMREALQKAWIRLRYEHPTIGSRVEYNQEDQKCKKVYETFSETFPQTNWLDTTFRVISNGMSGRDWCNSDPPVPALPTIFLIMSPSGIDRVSADLVLRAHHDVIDGIGTLTLFNNLFSHAAQAYEQQSSYALPKFGDEWVRLSPPLRVAASIPPKLEEKQAERMRDILAFNVALKENVEVASIPFRKDQVGPGKHQRVEKTLSKDVTTRLLDACRRAGLSVTHAYHTATALSVRDAQEQGQSERKVRYINYSLINERPHCEDPYGTPAHPASVYHSVSGRCLFVDLTVPALSSTKDMISGDETARVEFMEASRVIRDYYMNIRDDPEHIKFVPSYWAMSTLPYPSDGKTPTIPARNETPSVSISSMGVIDRIIRQSHGKFDLEEPWVTGEELGTGLGLFLGTWKGRLTLSAAYNDAWHDKGDVLEFLDRCNQKTLQALDIGSS